MIKKYFLCSVFFLAIPLIFWGQETLTKQAVVTKFSSAFTAGDTVEVVLKGRSYSAERKDYNLSFSAKSELGSWVTIPEKKLKIISAPFSFWKEQWFYKRSFPEQVTPKVPSKVVDNTKRLLRELAAHDMFLEDPVLEDYLLTLLDEIYGAEEAAFFPVRPYPKILKAQIPFAAGLSDGCIILSTGLLASVYSESELLGALTAQVTHLTLGHSIQNAQQDHLNAEFFDSLFSKNLLTFSTSSWLQYNANPLATSYQLAGELRADMGAAAIAGLNRVGAAYNDWQEADVDKIVREWLITNRKDPDAWAFLLDRHRRNFFYPAFKQAPLSAASLPAAQVPHTFGNLNKRLAELNFYFSHTEKVDVPDPGLDEILAEALAFHAWHEYYLKHYPRSLSAISRLIKTEIADAQHYLLYARLLRSMYPHGEMDQMAVDMIEEGRKRMVKKIPELHEEEVLIFMRMGYWNEANKALGRLEYMLGEMYEDDTITAKKEWAKRMRRRVKLAEKKG